MDKWNQFWPIRWCHMALHLIHSPTIPPLHGQSNIPNSLSLSLSLSFPSQLNTRSFLFLFFFFFFFFYFFSFFSFLSMHRCCPHHLAVAASPEHDTRQLPRKTSCWQSDHQSFSLRWHHVWPTRSPKAFASRCHCYSISGLTFISSETGAGSNQHSMTYKIVPPWPDESPPLESGSLFPLFLPWPFPINQSSFMRWELLKCDLLSKSFHLRYIWTMFWQKFQESCVTRPNCQIEFVLICMQDQPGLKTKNRDHLPTHFDATLLESALFEVSLLHHVAWKFGLYTFGALFWKMSILLILFRLVESNFRLK